MRTLEITIVGLLLIALIGQLLPSFRKNTLRHYLPIVAGVLIPVHLLLEGYRWQMVPVFVFTALFIIVSLLQLKRSKEKDFLISNKYLRAVVVTFTFLIFVLCIIFPILLPVVDLPAPDGPYDVGRTSFRMIDDQREEIFTEDPDDYRNLLVTVWYPAEVADGKSTASYWDEEGITGRAYSINSGMGSFWYSHLSLVNTNSVIDAPVATGEPRFPVIIYSHSFYGLNTENTMLMEELASKGYIVFSIAHSYETIVSVYPDGEAVTGYLDHIFDLYDAHADTEEQLYIQFEESNTPGEKKELLKQIMVVDEESNQLIKTRTEDAMFVLDQIERLNESQGIFNSKIDTSNVGIVGWSFGGATAMEACLSDPRFKAGINIDGWPYGKLFQSEDLISQPLMMVRSEPEDEMEAIVSDVVLEKIQHTGLIASVENAWHLNFWDFPLFFDVYQYLGYWGPINPDKLLEIEKSYINGFFDQHLKEKEVTLLDETTSPYPEVTVKLKSP